MRRMTIGLACAALALAGCGPAQSAPLMAQLEALAAKGNAEAIYHIGMAHQVGAGAPRDPVKALDAFRKAAALGDPLAAYKLGCYHDGQGEGLVARDEAQALRYKLVAADAGYALAQQDVAFLLVRKGDTAAALDWLGKAAAQGWTDAIMTYASVHNGAPGVPRDPVKTAAYFRLFLDRAQPTDAQRDWLAGFEAKLTPEQRAEAGAIVRAYRPAPTPLTIKALSGQRAAEQLVARS